MVDNETYFKLHTALSPWAPPELEPGAMDKDSLPDDRFGFLVPLKIRGFNLREKKVHQPTFIEP